MIVFAVFVALIFLTGLVGRRLNTTVITIPMVFTLAGLLLSFLVPSLTRIEIRDPVVLLTTEITLVALLFTDGSRIDVRNALGGFSIPARLLGIGMPLTILAGVGAAVVLFPGLGLWEAAILATILAPTDAGLGQVVVNSPLVPQQIREALDVEAGLNDGLSVPFLMLFISLARAEQPFSHQSWVLFAVQLIGVGVLSGIVLGRVGGWLIEIAQRRGWTVQPSRQLALLALAVLAWLVAEANGGNGFIAAFVAGLSVKTVFVDAGDHMTEFSEAWGTLLDSFVFMVFGTLAGLSLWKGSSNIVLYAVLSLTVVRMIPVAVALIGMQLRPVTVLFLGWFGPRGLASVVLGLVYLEQEAALPGEPLVVLAVITTVLCSVIAHGMSAAPAIRVFARQPGEAGAVE